MLRTKFGHAALPGSLECPRVSGSSDSTIPRLPLGSIGFPAPESRLDPVIGQLLGQGVSPFYNFYIPGCSDRELLRFNTSAPATTGGSSVGASASVFFSCLGYHTTATVSRQRAKMSKVAKYRRQVSEDPDIDSLLSTLSPEEMEELEKELDVVDSDGSIPLELSQKNQTENSPAGPQNCDTTLNHREKETRKAIQREHSIDVSHISPRLRWLCQECRGAPVSSAGLF